MDWIFHLNIFEIQTISMKINFIKILKEIPESWNEYESILEKIF